MEEKESIAEIISETTGLKTYTITTVEGEITLSSNLLKKQVISDENANLICHAHLYKARLIKEMKALALPEDLQSLAKQVTELEFYLQELWGFPKNINYHKWWILPGCSCPNMDNEDAYPSGNYTVDSECPVHGDVFGGS